MKYLLISFLSSALAWNALGAGHIFVPGTGGNGNGGGNAPAAAEQVPDSTPITDQTTDLRFKTGAVDIDEVKKDVGENEMHSIWKAYQDGEELDFIQKVLEKDTPSCSFTIYHPVGTQVTLPWGSAIDVRKVQKKVTTKDKPDVLGSKVLDLRVYFTHQGNSGIMICTLYTDKDRDFTYGDLRRAYGKRIAFDKTPKPKVSFNPLAGEMEKIQKELDRLKDAFPKAPNEARKAKIVTEFLSEQAKLKRLQDVVSKNNELLTRSMKLLGDHGNELPGTVKDALNMIRETLETTGNLGKKFNVVPDGLKGNVEKEMSFGAVTVDSFLKQVESQYNKQ